MHSPDKPTPDRDDRIPIGPGDVISVDGPIRAFPVRGGLAIEKAEHIHGKRLFAAVRGTSLGFGVIHKLLGDSFGQIEGSFGLHRFSMGLVKGDGAGIAKAPCSVYHQSRICEINVRAGGALKPYVHAAISNLYFFAPRFHATKTPMLATLRAGGKGGKRAYPVSLTAAGCLHSASMPHHARFNSALGLPDDHSIHTSDMGVRGGLIKGFVSQAHGLVEKLFMVHRQIIYGLGLVGHSYFPVDWYVYIVGKVTLNRIQCFLHEVELT